MMINLALSVAKTLMLDWSFLGGNQIQRIFLETLHDIDSSSICYRVHHLKSNNCYISCIEWQNEMYFALMWIYCFG